MEEHVHTHASEFLDMVDFVESQDFGADDGELFFSL